MAKSIKLETKRWGSGVRGCIGGRVVHFSFTRTHHNFSFGYFLERFSEFPKLRSNTGDSFFFVFQLARKKGAPLIYIFD